MPKTTVESLGENIYRALTDATERVIGPKAKNILWEAEQSSLRDAILSDLSDLVPLVGEFFDTSRTMDAAAKGKQRSARAVSLAAGTLPRPIGNIVDFLTPIQTITYLESRGYNVADLPFVFAKELGLRIPSLEGAINGIMADVRRKYMERR